ncbi:MAG TPA: SDR family oxidoreductase [Blastocatellia bacterium]|nr:SDR family oxidoreductase [Blastocatellia bacterium]
MKRFAEPRDVAGEVLFLTSDDAAFITGQALVIYGGSVSHRLRKERRTKWCRTIKTK